MSAATTTAQSGSDVKFTSLTSSSGISHNTISTILKDDLGFIWIGTNDGLNRYDAKNQFKVFRDNDLNIPDGLQSSDIRSMHKSKDGVLWIGTRLGGLTMYDVHQNRWATYRHDENNEHSISNDEILSIYEDSKNQLWIGTENGLNLFDRQNHKFIRFLANTKDPSALQARAVLTITEDDKGWLWAGTWGGGLYLLQPKANTNSRQYNFRQFFPDAKKNSHNVWKIFQDAQNRYWIGSHGAGLYLMELPAEASLSPDQQSWEPRFIRYSTAFENPHAISHNSIQEIFQDSQGRLWVGTVFGLNHISAEDLEQLPTEQSTNKSDYEIVFNKHKYSGSDQSSIADNNILSIFEDDQGLIWIATFSGVSILNWYTNQFEVFELFNDLANIPNSQNLYIRSNGVAWIGNGTEGIFRYDFKKRKILPSNKKYSKLLEDEIVTSVFSPNDIDLYLGTSAGVVVLNMEKETAKKYELPSTLKKNLLGLAIRCIIVDQQSRIWAGTELGLIKIDQTSGEFQSFINDPSDPTSLSDNSITDILETAAGEIWIGTYNGLNKVVINKDQISFKSFRHEDNNEASIPSNRAIVLEEINGHIYIGTTNGLCAYFPEKNQFYNFSKFDNKHHFAGFEKTDNGALWASTNEGILEFNTHTQTFNVFEEEDGLGDQSFLLGSSQRDRQGHIYYGSRKGFTRFHPNRIVKNKQIPQVYVTDIKILGTEEALHLNGVNQKEITLEHDDYYIALNFAGLNYNRPEKNKYQYKLIGFDESWIDASSNLSAVYTNLHHGEYEFRVRASNNDGYWNEKGTRLKIKVRAAYWQTWLFQLGVGLFALCLLLLAIKLYTKNMQTRNAALKVYNANLNNEIQERQKIERALEIREQFLRLIMDNIPQHIYWVDKQHKFLGANSSFLQSLDLINEAEIIGKDFSQYFSDEAFVKHQQQLEKEVMTVGKAILADVRFVKGTTEEEDRWMERNNIPLKNEEGKAIGVLVSVQDISSTVQAKEILTLHSARLASLVGKRTEKLAAKNDEVQQLLNQLSTRNEELELIVQRRTEKLSESNKELLRSNHDLEQFAYIASHDLQEPLRIISNFVSLLARRYKDKLDETGLEYIGYTTDAAKRMSNLIKSILTYSQVGKKEIDLQLTDINKLLEAKLLDLSQRIQETNAAIQIDPLPEVHCESNQIGMVFYNLINNAIKFNKSEKPTVEIRSHEADEEGYWKFSIKDNGIGIAPKFKQKIFEIFRRLHHKQDYEGTGIGLAVCQKIILRHGGKIWIDSTIDQGTTFYFTISKTLNTKTIDTEAPRIFEMEN